MFLRLKKYLTDQHVICWYKYHVYHIQCSHRRGLCLYTNGIVRYFLALALISNWNTTIFQKPIELPFLQIHKKILFNLLKNLRKFNFTWFQAQFNLVIKVMH